MGVRSPRNVTLPSGEAYQGVRIAGTQKNSNTAAMITTSYQALTVDLALLVDPKLVTPITDERVFTMRLLATCSEVITLANDDDGSDGTRTIPANEEFVLEFQSWLKSSGVEDQSATYYIKAANNAALNYRILWGE